MNMKKNFNELYKEYLKSIIFKSLVFATLFSCTVLAIMSFAFWYNDVKQYWIALIVFAVLELVLFSVMFFILRPTEKKFAKKLDSLGLKERVVTMYQYQNDDSLMARIQRGNAVEYINKINKKLVRLATPVFIVVLFAIAIISGATTTTMAALASNDYIPGGPQTFKRLEEVFGDKVEYEVTFDVIGDGFIDGDIIQIVYEGEDCTAVVAIPEDGWMFAGWHYTNDKMILQSQKLFGWGDDDTDAYHVETKVTKNLTVYAEFVEIPDYNGDDQNGNNKPGKPGESPLPQKPGEEKPKPSQQPGDGDGASAGRDEANNQVFDGNTFYGGSVYENAYNDAMNSMQQNGEMSDGQKDAVSDYFTTIEK